MFWQECLHFRLLHLGGDAVVGGVAGNQSLFDRLLESTVQGEVDASDCGAAQAGVALAAAFLNSTFFHQVFAELLEITRGQLFKFDPADAGDGVGFDD